MATNKPNQVPDKVWRAILKEAAKGTSYAELARKWGPKVEREYGLRLSPTQIARRVRREEPNPPPLESEALLALGDAFWQSLSPEDIDSFPHDGSKYHDHYCHGVPKERI